MNLFARRWLPSAVLLLAASAFADPASPASGIADGRGIKNGVIDVSLDALLLAGPGIYSWQGMPGGELSARVHFASFVNVGIKAGFLASTSGLTEQMGGSSVAPLGAVTVGANLRLTDRIHFSPAVAIGATRVTPYSAGGCFGSRSVVPEQIVLPTSSADLAFILYTDVGFHVRAAGTIVAFGMPAEGFAFGLGLGAGWSF